MSVADPSVVARVRPQWDAGPGPALAVQYRLDPDLVLAVVCQESAGDTYAWRPEPAFLRRRQDGILTSVQRVKDPVDRRRYLEWMSKDPLIFATSMGLMQSLVITAIEHGIRLAYPTSLCDPAVGLAAGCTKLGMSMSVLREPKAALQDYNGGGNPDYADEVLAWRTLIRMQP